MALVFLIMLYIKTSSSFMESMFTTVHHDGEFPVEVTECGVRCILNSVCEGFEVKDHECIFLEVATFTEENDKWVYMRHGVLDVSIYIFLCIYYTHGLNSFHLCTLVILGTDQNCWKEGIGYMGWGGAGCSVL